MPVTGHKKKPKGRGGAELGGMQYNKRIGEREAGIMAFANCG